MLTTGPMYTAGLELNQKELSRLKYYLHRKNIQKPKFVKPKIKEKNRKNSIFYSPLPDPDELDEANQPPIKHTNFVQTTPTQRILIAGMERDGKFIYVTY